MLEKHKAKKLQEQRERELTTERLQAAKAHEFYEAQLAAWQRQWDELALVVQEANARKGGGSSTVVLKNGESVFGAISGVGLIELRKVGGHFEGGSAGISVPIGTIHGRSVRYRVGGFRGHYVQGTPHPQAVDRGTLTSIIRAIAA